MNLGTYGILIAFGAFIVLLILNPKLSCFGKRIRSPLYPILRSRQKKAPPKVQTTDYGFKLSENPPAGQPAGPPKPGRDKAEKKADDHGFRPD